MHCIIVKDLSRFGRDYIEAGNYIEHIFPFMQVRFISINDNYDSELTKGRTPGIDIPFRNLAHTFYSMDISDKVCASVDIRRANGKFTDSHPPYGYVQNDKKCWYLIVTLF